MIQPIRVLKGVSGAVDVGTWETNGRVFVSVTPLNLDPDKPGQYVRRKGGFACSPGEARDIAAALQSIAAGVEASPPEPQPTEDDREGSRWP